MDERQTRKLYRAIGFLLLSLLIHAQLVLIISSLFERNLEQYQFAQNLSSPIEVIPLTRQESPLSPKRSETTKKKRKEDKIKGQVVQIQPPKQEEHPDDARFLSEYDSKVVKEKKDKRVGLRPRRSSTRPLPRKSRSSDRQSKEMVSRPAVAAQPRMKGESREPRRGHAIPRSSQKNVSAAWQARRKNKGSSAAEPRHSLRRDPGESAMHRLSVSNKILDSVIDQAHGRMDYLEGIEEGEETLLNTKRWRFANFFNRIGSEIGPNWRSRLRASFRIRDPSARIYGSRERRTILEVDLDRDGRVADIRIVRSSGVSFIDDAAVQAIRYVQPFPNPPKELINGAGLITFQWGFIVLPARSFLHSIVEGLLGRN